MIKNASYIINFILLIAVILPRSLLSLYYGFFVNPFLLKIIILGLTGIFLILMIKVLKAHGISQWRTFLILLAMTAMWYIVEAVLVRLFILAHL